MRSIKKLHHGVHRILPRSWSSDKWVCAVSSIGSCDLTGRYLSLSGGTSREDSRAAPRALPRRIGTGQCPGRAVLQERVRTGGVAPERQRGLAQSEAAPPQSLPHRIAVHRTVFPACRSVQDIFYPSCLSASSLEPVRSKPKFRHPVRPPCGDGAPQPPARGRPSVLRTAGRSRLPARASPRLPKPPPSLDPSPRRCPQDGDAPGVGRDRPPCPVVADPAFSPRRSMPRLEGLDFSHREDGSALTRNAG